MASAQPHLRPACLRVLLMLAATFLAPFSIMAENLRIGIIGVDTSHAEEFALRLNDPTNPNHVPGGRVIIAYPASSPDLPDSASRVQGYTETLRDKYGVKIASSTAELCAAADAIMILSLDGRPHLDQAKDVIASGKPFFLDKPVAASLKDAVEIYKLAAAAKVPLFSASAVRWYPGVVEVAGAAPGPAQAALSYGPSPILPFHPDLFFYGIHPTEALFTIMGEGCQSVSRVTSQGSSVVTGVWNGDRLGTLHALHSQPMGSAAYRVVRFDPQAVVEQKTGGDYTPMLREIIKFFQTKLPPVTPRQTLEIYAFMEAAEESKRRGGARVSLRETLLKAGAPEEWLPVLPPPPAPVPAPTPQTAPAGSPPPQAPESPKAQ